MRALLIGFSDDVCQFGLSGATIFVEETSMWLVNHACRHLTFCRSGPVRACQWDGHNGIAYDIVFYGVSAYRAIAFRGRCCHALLLERCRVVCRSNSSYLLIASVRAGRRAEAASHARARRLFGSCVRHSWQHRGSHRCTGITNNFGSGFWSAPIFDYTHPKGTWSLTPLLLLY